MFRSTGSGARRISTAAVALCVLLSAALIAPVVGAGARLYPEAFPHAVGPEHPDARVLARVVTDERAELLDPEPLYLRRPDVAAPGARKPVS